MITFASRIWRAFLPRARIRLRIVAAVVLSMAVVLAGTSTFVFWRIQHALDRQVDQDLRAYTDLVANDVREGEPLPADNPGEVAQTFSAAGRLLGKSDAGVRRLLTPRIVRTASESPRQLDIGPLLTDDETPYRLRFQRVTTPQGEVVLVTAISRHKRDEALRELFVQLTLADLAAIAAAGIVGWAAAGAALGPVEQYRRTAAEAGGDPSVRLPVEPGRDDELSRLGITFNDLLAAIEASHQRERQFLADASHELRSPLALLGAEVEWAQHRPRSAEEIATVLESVGGQTRRLAALADALLDLEEASATSALRREPVPLAALVEGADDIDLTVDDAEVFVEPRWVELAIANLVANARKHGSGRIAVHAVVADGRLTLDVTDEGGGIPAGLGEAAFERFARADTARSTPGNGLGLAIVAAVARRHGGAASLIDGGVRIELPVGATRPRSTG